MLGLRIKMVIHDTAPFYVSMMILRYWLFMKTLPICLLLSFNLLGRIVKNFSNDVVGVINYRV